MGSRKRLVLILAATWSLGLAGGSCHAASAPPLELTVSQRQTVGADIWKTSIAALPIGFEASVGTQVPPALRLQSLPQTVTDQIPAMRGVQYLKTRNQIILVDPLTRTVVAIINR